MDIILLAVLVIFVIRGSRKGFVRMLLETIGAIVAVVAGWFVSKTYSGMIYDSYFKEGVIRGIDGRLTGNDSLDAATVSFYSIPDRLRGIAAMLGFDADGFSKTVDAKNASAAETLESSVVGPAVTIVLKILVFIAVVLVFSIIIRFIIGIVGRATKLPTIKKADGVLGGILGFLTGIVVVFLLAEIIFAVSGMIDNELIADKISASFVIRFVGDASKYIVSLF